MMTNHLTLRHHVSRWTDHIAVPILILFYRGPELSLEHGGLAACVLCAPKPICWFAYCLPFKMSDHIHFFLVMLFMVVVTAVSTAYILVQSQGFKSLENKRTNRSLVDHLETHPVGDKDWYR